MRTSEVRAAAAMLRAIVQRIRAGELTAPAGVTARLEGAVTIDKLECVDEQTQRRITQRARLSSEQQLALRWRIAQAQINRALDEFTDGARPPRPVANNVRAVRRCVERVAAQLRA